MSRTAAALADFRFGLKFAAKRYLGYADRVDKADNAGLYRQLADESLEDAARLDQEAGQNGLALQLRFHLSSESMGYHDLDKVMDVGIGCRGNA